MNCEYHKKALVEVLHFIFCGKNCGHLIFFNFALKNFFNFLRELLPCEIFCPHYLNKLHMESLLINNNLKKTLGKCVSAKSIFTFSRKNFFPFKIILIKQFEQIPYENQNLFKIQMDKKSSKLKFFFFCESLENLNKFILSRCSILNFLQDTSQFFSDDCEIYSHKLEIDDKENLIKIIRRMVKEFEYHCIRRNLKSKKNKLLSKPAFYKTSWNVCNEFYYFLFEIIKKRNTIKKFTHYLNLYFQKNSKLIITKSLKFFFLKKKNSL